MTSRAFRSSPLRRAYGLAWVICLLMTAAAGAQICDEEKMPEPAALADTLVPPAIDWQMDLFYPPWGSYLDQIDSTSYYSLETRFGHFGLPVKPDQTESQPEGYYLPLGWEKHDMITFRWVRPGNTQIVHEPELRRGGISIPDPAAPANELSISPQILIRGSYTGKRDQVFVFEYRGGELFCGDHVYSNADPSRLAWSASGHLIDGVPWYETDDLFIPVGGVGVIETEINWSELYSPDQEFSYAPDDARLSGVIVLSTTYQRVSADSVRVTDTNIDCAHGLFPKAWYPDEYDPETDPSAYGIFVSFSPGAFTAALTYNLVVEDFEGYHVWRRQVGSDSGWLNVWKISYNEERDKAYWWWIAGEFVPTSPPYYGYDPSSLTPVFGGGNNKDNKRVFLDFDVHNGFEYDYAITGFDRGFRPASGGNDHYLWDSAIGVFNEGNADSTWRLDAIARRVTFNRKPGQILEKQLYAVPNPLRTGKSAVESPTYHNFPGDVVRFVGLTPGSELKVYSLAGDLIAELGSQRLEGANMVWDTRNQLGELVASGVYIYKATNPRGEKEYGRLAIIR